MAIPRGLQRSNRRIAPNCQWPCHGPRLGTLRFCGSLSWARAQSDVQELRLDLHWLPSAAPEVASPPALCERLGTDELHAHRSKYWIVEPTQVRSELRGTFPAQILHDPAFQVIHAVLEGLPITLDELEHPVVRIAAFLADGSTVPALVHAQARCCHQPGT